MLFSAGISDKRRFRGFPLLHQEDIDTPDILFFDGSRLNLNPTFHKLYAQTQVSDDGSFTDSISYYTSNAGHNHLMKTSITIVDRTYYVRVRYSTEKDGKGTIGEWSNVITYNGNINSYVNQPPSTPPKPSVVVPVHEGIYVTPTPTPYYLQIQFDDNDTFTSPTDIHSTTNRTYHPHVRWDAPEDGQYVRARYTTAINGGGVVGPWSDSVYYPFATILPTFPTNIIVHKQGLQHFIKAYHLPSQYYFHGQYSTSEEFDPTMTTDFYDNNNEDSSYHEVDFKPGGFNYYIRTRFTTDKNGEGEFSEWSNTVHYKLDSDAPEPNDMPIPENLVINEREIATYPVEFDYVFEVEWSHNEDFILATNRTDKSQDRHFNVSWNEPEGITYIRARFRKRDDTPGPWTDTYTYVNPPTPELNLTDTSDNLTTDRTTNKWYLTLQITSNNVYDKWIRETYITEEASFFNLSTWPLKTSLSEFHYRVRFTTEPHDSGIKSEWSNVVKRNYSNTEKEFWYSFKLNTAGNVVTSITAHHEDNANDVNLGDGRWLNSFVIGNRVWIMDSISGYVKKYTNDNGILVRDSTNDVNLGTGSWFTNIVIGDNIWFVDNTTNYARVYVILDNSQILKGFPDVNLGSGSWFTNIIIDNHVWLVNNDSNTAEKYTYSNGILTRDSSNDVNLGSGFWYDSIIIGNNVWFIDSNSDYARKYTYSNGILTRDSTNDVNIGGGSWRDSIVIGNDVWFINDDINLGIHYINNNGILTRATSNVSFLLDSDYYNSSIVINNHVWFIGNTNNIAKKYIYNNGALTRDNNGTVFYQWQKRPAGTAGVSGYVNVTEAGSGYNTNTLTGGIISGDSEYRQTAIITNRNGVTSAITRPNIFARSWDSIPVQPVITYSYITEGYKVVGIRGSLNNTDRGTDYLWQYRESYGYPWKFSYSEGFNTDTLSNPIPGYHYRLTWNPYVYDDNDGYIPVENLGTEIDQDVIYKATLNDKHEIETIRGEIEDSFGINNYQWESRSSSSAEWEGLWSITSSRTKTLILNDTDDYSGHSFRLTFIRFRKFIYPNSVFEFPPTIGDKPVVDYTRGPTNSGTTIANITATLRPFEHGIINNYQWQMRKSDTDEWRNSGDKGNQTTTIDPSVGYQYRLSWVRTVSSDTNPVDISEHEDLYITVIGNYAPITGIIYNFVNAFTNNDLTATFPNGITGITSYRWQYREDSSSNWAYIPATVPGYGDPTGLNPDNDAPGQYRISWVRYGVREFTANYITLTVDIPPIITYDEDKPSPGSLLTAIFSSEDGITSYQWQRRFSDTGSWADAVEEGNTTKTIRVGNIAGTQYRITWVRKTNREAAIVHAVIKQLIPPVVSYSTTYVTQTLSSATLSHENGIGDYQWEYRDDITGGWVNSTDPGYNTKSIFIRKVGQYRFSWIREGQREYPPYPGFINIYDIWLRPNVRYVNKYEVINTAITPIFTYTHRVVNYQWQYRKDETLPWSNTTETGSTYLTFTPTYIGDYRITWERDGVREFDDVDSHHVQTFNSGTDIVRRPKVHYRSTIEDIGSSVLAVFEYYTGITSYLWQVRDSDSDNWTNATETGNTTDTIIPTGGKQYRIIWLRNNVWEDRGDYVDIPVGAVSVKPTVTYTQNKTNGITTSLVGVLNDTSHVSDYQWLYRANDSDPWIVYDAVINGVDYYNRNKINKPLPGYQYKLSWKRYFCIEEQSDNSISVNGINNTTIVNYSTYAVYTASVATRSSETVTAEFYNDKGITSFQWQYKALATSSWNNVTNDIGHNTKTITIPYRKSGNTHAGFYRISWVRNGTTEYSLREVEVNHNYANFSKPTVTYSNLTPDLGDKIIPTFSHTYNLTEDKYFWQVYDSFDYTWKYIKAHDLSNLCQILGSVASIGKQEFILGKSNSNISFINNIGIGTNVSIVVRETNSNLATTGSISSSDSIIKMEYGLKLRVSWNRNNIQEQADSHVIFTPVDSMNPHMKKVNVLHSPTHVYSGNHYLPTYYNPDDIQKVQWQGLKDFIHKNKYSVGEWKKCEDGGSTTTTLTPVKKGIYRLSWVEDNVRLYANEYCLYNFPAEGKPLVLYQRYIVGNDSPTIISFLNHTTDVHDYQWLYRLVSNDIWITGLLPSAVESGTSLTLPALTDIYNFRLSWLRDGVKVPLLSSKLVYSNLTPKQGEHVKATLNDTTGITGNYQWQVKLTSNSSEWYYVSHKTIYGNNVWFIDNSNNTARKYTYSNGVLTRDNGGDISLGNGIWRNNLKIFNNVWFIDSDSDHARKYTYSNGILTRDNTKDVNLGSGTWRDSFMMTNKTTGQIDIWFIDSSINNYARKYILNNNGGLTRDNGGDINLGGGIWHSNIIIDNHIWLMNSTADTARKYTYSNSRLTRDSANDVRLSNGVWYDNIIIGNDVWIVNDTLNRVEKYTYSNGTLTSANYISLGNGTWWDTIVINNDVWFIDDNSNYARKYTYNNGGLTRDNGGDISLGGGIWRDNLFLSNDILIRDDNSEDTEFAFNIHIAFDTDPYDTEDIYNDYNNIDVILRKDMEFRLTWIRDGVREFDDGYVIYKGDEPPFTIEDNVREYSDTYVTNLLTELPVNQQNFITYSPKFIPTNSTVEATFSITSIIKDINIGPGTWYDNIIINNHVWLIDDSSNYARKYINNNGVLVRDTNNDVNLGRDVWRCGFVIGNDVWFVASTADTVRKYINNNGVLTRDSSNDVRMGVGNYRYVVRINNDIWIITSSGSTGYARKYINNNGVLTSDSTNDVNLGNGVWTINAAIIDNHVWFIDNDSDHARKYTYSNGILTRDSANDVNLGSGVWQNVIVIGNDVWFIGRSYGAKKYTHSNGSLTRDNTGDIELDYGFWYTNIVIGNHVWLVDSGSDIANKYTYSNGSLTRDIVSIPRSDYQWEYIPLEWENIHPLVGKSTPLHASLNDDYKYRLAYVKHDGTYLYQNFLSILSLDKKPTVTYSDNRPNFGETVTATLSDMTGVQNAIGGYWWQVEIRGTWFYLDSKYPLLHNFDYRNSNYVKGYSSNILTMTVDAGYVGNNYSKSINDSVDYSISESGLIGEHNVYHTSQQLNTSKALEERFHFGLENDSISLTVPPDSTDIQSRIGRMFPNSSFLQYGQKFRLTWVRNGVREFDDGYIILDDNLTVVLNRNVANVINVDNDVNLGSGNWYDSIVIGNDVWFIDNNSDHARKYTYSNGVLTRDSSNDVNLGSGFWWDSIVIGNDVWFIDRDSDHARKYTYSNGVLTRDSSNDVNLGSGFWYDSIVIGNDVWFIDSNSDYARKYTYSNGVLTRDSSNDVNLGSGFWYDSIIIGNDVWFIDNNSDHARKYTYSNGILTRDSTNDVNLGSGNWYDSIVIGNDVWFVARDSGYARKYTYNNGTLTRDSSNDVNLGSGNWYDSIVIGNDVWFIDSNSDYARKYTYSNGVLTKHDLNIIGGDNVIAKFSGDIENILNYDWLVKKVTDTKFINIKTNFRLEIDVNLGSGNWWDSIVIGNDVWFIDSDSNYARKYTYSNSILTRDNTNDVNLGNGNWRDSIVIGNDVWFIDNNSDYARKYTYSNSILTRDNTNDVNLGNGNWWDSIVIGNDVWFIDNNSNYARKYTYSNSILTRDNTNDVNLGNGNWWDSIVIGNDVWFIDNNSNYARKYTYSNSILTRDNTNDVNLGNGFWYNNIVIGNDVWFIDDNTNYARKYTYNNGILTRDSSNDVNLGSGFWYDSIIIGNDVWFIDDISDYARKYTYNNGTLTRDNTNTASLTLPKNDIYIGSVFRVTWAYKAGITSFNYVNSVHLDKVYFNYPRNYISTSLFMGPAPTVIYNQELVYDVPETITAILSDTTDITSYRWVVKQINPLSGLIEKYISDNYTVINNSNSLALTLSDQSQIQDTSDIFIYRLEWTRNGKREHEFIYEGYSTKYNGPYLLGTSSQQLSKYDGELPVDIKYASSDNQIIPLFLPYKTDDDGLVSFNTSYFYRRYNDNTLTTPDRTTIYTDFVWQYRYVDDEYDEWKPIQRFTTKPPRLTHIEVDRHVLDDGAFHGGFFDYGDLAYNKEYRLLYTLYNKVNNFTPENKVYQNVPLPKINYIRDGNTLKTVFTFGNNVDNTILQNKLISSYRWQLFNTTSQTWFDINGADINPYTTNFVSGQRFRISWTFIHTDIRYFADSDYLVP